MLYQNPTQLVQLLSLPLDTSIYPSPFLRRITYLGKHVYANFLTNNQFSQMPNDYLYHPNPSNDLHKFSIINFNFQLPPTSHYFKIKIQYIYILLISNEHISEYIIYYG